MVDDKKKRKKWYSILASEEFNFAKIGESFVEEAGDLVGRKVAVNLMVLTNDSKKQNANAIFKIVGVKDQAGVCELVGYRISKSYTRRVVRKAIDKVEDSFRVESKDHVFYLVKPLIVTRYPCQRSRLTGIQKRIREYITEEFKALDHQQIFGQVISNTLQVALRSVLKKIYPVAISEIRVLERL